MKRLFTLSALGMGLAALPAMAVTITPYYDATGSSSTFTTALSTAHLTNQVLEQFNGSVSLFTNIQFLGNPGQGLTRGTIPSTGPYVNELEDQVAGPLPSPLQYTVISRTDGTPLYAIGANWDLGPGNAGTNLHLSITLLNNTVVNLTQNLGDNTGNAGGAFFFGFISDTPFQSLTVTSELATQGSSTAETYAIDNLVTAAAPVPEPATFGLMGLTLAGLGLARRRNRR